MTFTVTDCLTCVQAIVVGDIGICQAPRAVGVGLLDEPLTLTPRRGVGDDPHGSGGVVHDLDLVHFLTFRYPQGIRRSSRLQ